MKKTEKMIKKKGKNRKTKILLKKIHIKLCGRILFLSIDYCNIYTISEKKRRFMMLFFLGGGSGMG